MKRAWHETFFDMRDAIAKAFKGAGKSDSDAMEYADISIKAIAQNYAGEYVYVPSSLLARIAARDRRIYSEFDGNNHTELARKYGVTVIHMYRIIKKQRAQSANRKDKPEDGHHHQ